METISMRKEFGFCCLGTLLSLFINLMLLSFLAFLLYGCSSVPSCTKVVGEFYEKAGSDNMDMATPVIEENRFQFAAFDEDDVIMLCLIGTNASFDTVSCAAMTKKEGVCRSRQGRFMGFSMGKARAIDMLGKLK
jgi:hypothetical protein